MYPHERSLVKRLKDKPFVLLGVNTDDGATLKQRIKDRTITWECFSDGDTTGPITSHWNITMFPTLFIIDKRGVIRYANLHSEFEIDSGVDKLLAEPAK
jgi:peroxiredoxin